MTPSYNKIMAASRYARTAHSGQARKYTGDPYVYHPARVSARAALLDGATEDIVCAAWLHDVIEDCNKPLADIYQLFGDHVGLLVRELTNTSKKTAPASPRHEHKLMDRHRLHSVSPWAQNLKILDRLDNLREMDGAERDFRDLYATESKLLLSVLDKAASHLIFELDTEIHRVMQSL